MNTRAVPCGSCGRRPRLFFARRTIRCTHPDCERVIELPPHFQLRQTGLQLVALLNSWNTLQKLCEYMSDLVYADLEDAYNAPAWSEKRKN